MIRLNTNYKIFCLGVHNFYLQSKHCVQWGISKLYYWVNPSKRGGIAGGFQRLAGRLRGISRGQSPREIPKLWNFEIKKLRVGSKTGSKNSVLAFLKCMDGSVLAFLKCMDGSVLVFLKCMDGSVLAHLRFPMQSAPTRFPQSGNSEVP